MGRRRAPDKLIAARRRFLSEGATRVEDIPLPILRSWKRSVELGLDMEAAPEIHVLSPQELNEAQQRNEMLVRAARGELESLFHDVGHSGGIAILTDPNGVVLFSLGKGEFAGDVARVALRPGAGWDEAVAGTNAIGAALAELHPISVIGREHFFETHRILSCSAVPIFDPSGAVAGVLDLTSSSDVPQTHTLALVNRAAEQIERTLFEAQFRNHEQMCFHTDPYLIGSPHEGLLAFEGERLAGANRSGIALLGLDWPARGAIRFDDLFTVEQGGVSQNPASDDCVVQTRKGKILYARMRPKPHVHRGWSPAEALAGGTHDGRQDLHEDIPLSENPRPASKRTVCTSTQSAAAQGGPAHLWSG